MNCVSKTAAAALWLAMAALPAINGQQPEAPKRRSPSLEADGPLMSKGHDSLFSESLVPPRRRIFGAEHCLWHRQLLQRIRNNRKCG